MAYSLIAHTKAASIIGGGTFSTSPSINTTGSDLIVVGVSQYQGAGVLAAPSDSVGNIYTRLTIYTAATNAWVALYYAQGAGVGSATHTFTLTGTTFYGVLYALAFSGSNVAPSDGDVGVIPGPAILTSEQVGPLVPSQDNDLIVSMLSGSTTGTSGYTIDSGFTQADTSTANAGSTCMGGACAYLIQTTAGSVSPTWSWTGAASSALALAAFKVAGPPALVAWPRPAVSF